MILGTLYLLAALCLILTLLPLSASEAWWVRAADFPKLQLAITTLATLIGLCLLGDITGMPDLPIALALTAALLQHTALILPYTPLWPVDIVRAEGKPSSDTVKLMVANVLMHNRETERLSALIESHQPDVLLFLEIDQWWCARIDAMTTAFPFRICHPQDDTYGIHLCSRLQLIDPEIRFLLKPDIPSIRTTIRLRSGRKLLYYGLHPEPPSPTEADSALPRDAELVTVAKEIAEAGRSTVVAGDFNDVAWSHTSRLFRRLSRLLDPRIGRGQYNSFHAHYWPCRWPLDHVFASDDFMLQDMERLSPFGSDHFPILVTLTLAPGETEHQSASTADDQDIAEADDKLERAKEDTSPQSSPPIPL